MPTVFNDISQIIVDMVCSSVGLNNLKLNKFLTLNIIVYYCFYKIDIISILYKPIKIHKTAFQIKKWNI